MKRSMFVLLSLFAIAVLSACVPQGTPTQSLAELQAIAMANAQTQIALTAAAIPTATQLPPTAMPTPIPVQPTEIIQQTVVVAAQPVSVTPTALPGVVLDQTNLSDDNPCGGPLSDIKGPQAQVTFNNNTDGDLSLYLYSYKTEFGCGIGNVNLAPLESVTTSIPQACYDFYGWITGPKDSTPAGFGCLNFDQTVTVRQDDLIFKDQ